MDCPKCVGKLQEKLIENYKVNVCWVCEGIWFDAGELDKVLAADSRDFDFIDVDRDALAGKEPADLREELDKKDAACPRCADGTMLVHKEHQGVHKVTIDACPKCNGIWLDGGEILELRHRGAVNLKDKLDDNLSFLRFIFSVNGFRDFAQQVFRRHRE